MLRRVDLNGPWRSLDSGFWPSDLPLGRRTIVYGHNGSGKSTIADLLLAVAQRDSSVDVMWESHDGSRTTISAGGSAPSPSMAVFTKRWVERNLAEFLDGESASAIVTLGQEAIHAKEEERGLEKEIAERRDDVSEAQKQQRLASNKVEKLAREAQGEIVGQLQEFDYKQYTKNRYSLPKVQEELRRYKGDFPNANEHAEALKRLGEGQAAAIDRVDSAPAGVVASLSKLSALLLETPARLALEVLERDSHAQAWVEDGLSLHHDLDDCLFCGGSFTDERRRRLDQHFDESWLNLRQDAESLLRQVERENSELQKWLERLPTADAFSGDLAAVADSELGSISAGVFERRQCLDAAARVLREKSADPSNTPGAPDLEALGRELSVVVLQEAVDTHNDQVERHAEVMKGHQETVLHHIVGSRSQAFRELVSQAEVAAEKLRTSNRAVELAESRLREVRQKQFSSSEMAKTLSADLARVYGKHHLSIVVTDDGKSYACRRGDEPATDLSDGERTTLSLLYFLRKLEDESHSSSEASERIVVVDDPSSSLDREALFATHQWLIDTLAEFGQVVVLTHDFGLLGLFLKSQRNAWGKSQAKIRDGDDGERRFPSVSFLEVYAASANGNRTTRVAALPALLRKSTSEYQYLFAMVMAGIADADDHERLFLLPNAARRVLEVFASYKAPHLPQFDQQLKALIDGVGGDPYRDVYDFCNRFSHGEGSESVDVLDARAMHGHIRRCMEFFRCVDREHFERMCRATGTDPNILV